MSIPFIAEEACPRETVYIIPPDVQEAMQIAITAQRNALNAVTRYLLALAVLPAASRHLAGPLVESACSSIRASGLAVKHFEVTARTAAIERRMWAITSLGR